MAAAVFSTCTLAQAAPQTQPPAPILNLVNTVIRATNADNGQLLAGLYTSDATVVDENPPFVWRGPQAGVAWWHVVDALLQKLKMTHLHATASRSSEFQQTPTDAYLIQPMLLTGSASGKAFREPGTMTYTFHRTGSSWKISSQIWTTKP